MTPRKRQQINKGLPERWALKHNAYYYRPRAGELHLFDGKAWFWLGKTLAEAHTEFAKRIDFSGDLHTRNQVCQRYSLEVLVTKAPATQLSQSRCMKRIRAALGANPAQAIESHHIYQYRDAVAKKYSQKAANLDLELLSHVFTKAIEWGARKGHPMTNKQVVKYSLPARDRYVTDAELAEALKLASPFVRQYITLKLILGARKGELLRIRLADITDHGVLINRTKGGRPSLYELTPALEAAIKSIRSSRKKLTGMHLFINRKGQPYIDADGKTHGFDSIWQRFMAKVVAAGIPRFTEHDLRAKVASDTTLERAQELLGHADARTTKRNYIRKAQAIRPAK